MSATATLLGVLAACGVGVGSALLPLVNAEAYAVLSTVAAPAALVVVALAVGQTVGKLVLFESARRGAVRWARTEAASRRARWTARVTPLLRRSRTGVPVVLAAAVVGLPPLAVVSLAAGASGQPRWVFASLVLVGRLARFAAIVVPAAHVAR